MGFAKVIVFFAKRHFPDERNLDQPPYSQGSSKHEEIEVCVLLKLQYVVNKAGSQKARVGTPNERNTLSLTDRVCRVI